MDKDQRTEAALLIHATNVTGLGARNVVVALLRALCLQLRRRTLIYLPSSEPLSGFRCDNPLVSVEQFHRAAPRAVSRTAECLLPQLYFPPSKQTLVLGDVPLRGRSHQTVLVHQPHLLAPELEPHVGRSATFRVMRRLFRANLQFVRNVLVQTPVMKEMMERSYPSAAGRMWLLRHPAPALARTPRQDLMVTAPGLRLLYPAAGYPHKNHALLQRMHRDGTGGAAGLHKIVVTLTPGEFRPLAAISWLENVGRLSPQEVTVRYGRVQALFFPSLLESFPLPFSEAMAAGLPILCPDLPYARDLCGSEGIYFDPQNASSAWEAIAELQLRLEGGWRPAWRSALAQMSPTWDATAAELLEVMDRH